MNALSASFDAALTTPHSITAVMSARRASMPAGLVTAEDLTPRKHTPSESSDSGYASIGSVPEGGPYQGYQTITEEFALHPRNIFDCKVKLKVFNKEIPQSTRYRFADLQELLARPLYDYLTKAKVHSSRISIKLKVLGENEFVAKPWILVFCSDTASKRVKKFFNQPQIKAEYKPCSTDPDRPSFEVHVCNWPPTPMATTNPIDVYGDWDETATMCGQVIEVGEPDQTRTATLGGVIKILASDASSKFYGMTAGHIIAQMKDELSEVEDSEDGESLDGENGLELDFELDRYHDIQELDMVGYPSRATAQLNRHKDSWPLKGHIAVASDRNYEPDLDWALIEFDDDAAGYWPNVFPGTDYKVGGSLRELACEPMMTDPDRSVVLLSGIGGPKQGTLSTSSSFLNMGLTKTFTETYTLTLSPNSVLYPGDCGSWVVDDQTYEVYGHVVASDILGEAYVVPLHATLQDITTRLAASSASLPTEFDIHQSLEQQSEIVLFNRDSTYPGVDSSALTPQPPIPNPFTTPQGLERLRNDVDRLCLAPVSLPQYPSFNEGRHSEKYQGNIITSSHQSRPPLPIAPAEFRRSGHQIPPASTAPPVASFIQRSPLMGPQNDKNLNTSSRRRPSRGTHDAFDNNSKGLVSYEAYRFTKEPAEHIGRKETWGYCRRTTMLVSQGSLAEQLNKQCQRGELASKQYHAPEMKGFKQRQIDRLIDRRNARDDPRFQYQLASVKLDQRRVQSGNIETNSMHVILKRQPRQGITFDPSWRNGVLPILSNEIVDLTDQKEPERTHSYPTSKESAHAPRGPIPASYQTSTPRGHIGYYGLCAAGNTSRVQDPGINRGPYPYPQEVLHPGHGDGINKPREKKHEPPRVINANPTRKKTSYVSSSSSSSSSSSESDNLSGMTNITGPTMSSEGRTSSCSKSYREENRAFHNDKRRQPTSSQARHFPSLGTNRPRHNSSTVNDRRDIQHTLPANQIPLSINPPVVPALPDEPPRCQSATLPQPTFTYDEVFGPRGPTNDTETMVIYGRRASFAHAPAEREMAFDM